MKNIVRIVLLLILVASCFCAALADTAIDFSGYSLDELMAIKTSLEEEIASRPGGERIVLGSGQYKIGEDLSAGIYTFKFIQNGDAEVDRTDYYVYENESMYKYDIDRLWLGDMPRVEGSLKGDGETRISLFPGECLKLQYNGAEIARVGNVEERKSDYIVPDGTSIPTGEYTIGVEIPADTYTIYYSGASTSRVRVFEDAKEAGNSFNKGKETVLNSDNTEGTIVVQEGNILRVEYTTIIMKRGGGFVFD